MDTPVMRRFGRYEILGQLGRGAMGVVYKARDPQIDRLVALKTVSLSGQEPDDVEEFRRRFRNEAQAAGRLHHPGIVAVFDVGEDPETRDPYLVLEYVAGEALNRRLAREKKLPLAKALQIAEEVAEALDYAHGQGVTHRDIKPGNILLTQDGHPKIADFGIAKLNLAHLTLPGKVLGTPAYMAPEQLTGQGSDGRSDLFSLGVILYAMVIGHSPFQGDNANTVCFQVANRDPVPASALDLNLPRELDKVIARAMAKEPGKRYQRGLDFAKDLHRLRDQYNLGTGTQKTSQAGLQGPPAVGLAYAGKVVRAAMLNTPFKDLILGVATVIMLVIVGLQSKLLVSSREEAANPGGVPTQVAGTAQRLTPGGAATSRSTVATRSTNAAPVHRAAVRSASAQASAANKAPSPPPAKEKEVVIPLSMVELAVRHQFKDATLFVFVDDKLALTRPLHGGAQKRLVVFNGVRGIESETLKVTAGPHVLRFQAQTADQTVTLSKTISADFIGGDDKTLQITFDKHNTVMKLEWQ